MSIDDIHSDKESASLVHVSVKRWFIPLEEDKVLGFLSANSWQDNTFCFHSSNTNTKEFFLTVKSNGKLDQLPILCCPEICKYTIGNPVKLSFNSLAELLSNMLINRVNIKVENDRELIFSNYLRCPIPAQKWFIAGKFDDEAKEHFINSVDFNKFAVWMNKSNDFTAATKTPTYESFKIQHQKSGYTLDTITFFNDVEQLITHYQRLPLPKENGMNKKILPKPFDYTSFYACMIDKRIEALMQPATAYSDKINGFYVEFSDLKVESKVHSSEYVESKKVKYQAKNRYRDILAYDHTRVILRDTQDDYINANYVEADFQSSPPAYILCQAPTTETIEDHWQMIIQENINTIVILTNFIEKGMQKCIKYWPDLNSKKYILNEKYCVLNVGEKAKRDIVQIHLELKNMTDNTKKDILVLHYIAWPDYGVPTDCWGIIELLTLTNQQRDIGPPLSVIVHCSAGIGRTGTFIILDMILNKIKTEGISTVIDIKESLLKARKQRAYLVSTMDQYKFIHLSLMKYIEWRLGQASFSICKKQRD
uniref:protein-tyrosine-phosphatase n=1 Tax=Myxobolus squamalis TaxID=59785 RepID=A0A6B2FZH6_MYXSQ